jgi:two-component system NarL family sensor kinase
MPCLLSPLTRLFFFSSLLVVFLFAIFIIFFIRFHKNQLNLVLEKNNLKYQFQQTLLQTQLEIQEQTLKNISQEIHDNIGQALTLAKINLSTILSAGDPQLQQKITDSKELVSKAINDLRDLSRSLDPIM